MSDPVLIALIANITAIVVQTVISLGNRKRLNEVHKATNSMKDELVAVTKSDSFKEGVAHQKSLDEGSKNP